MARYGTVEHGMARYGASRLREEAWPGGEGRDLPGWRGVAAGEACLRGGGGVAGGAGAGSATMAAAAELERLRMAGAGMAIAVLTSGGDAQGGVRREGEGGGGGGRAGGQLGPSPAPWGLRVRVRPAPRGPAGAQRERGPLSCPGARGGGAGRRGTPLPRVSTPRG